MENNPFKKQILKPINQFIEFRKYWKTKKAVLTGIPIYNWDTSEREQHGYLEPWTFNIQEGVFASLPSIFIVKILDFLFKHLKNDPQDLSSLDIRTKIFTETLQSTNQFFSSFSAPLIITLLVFIVGWSSLKRSDSNSESRARARRAYLYLDGSYGLIFQLILSLEISLITWGFNHEKFINRLPGNIYIIFVVFYVISILGQIIQTYHIIPQKLFKINGYSSRVRHFWQKKKNNDPPWSKFSTMTLLGAFPVLLVVTLIQHLLSNMTATFITSLRMLLV